MVDFDSDGTHSGGDTTFSYFGSWKQDGDRFKAAISAKRTAPGPPGVFGMDEVDITVAGHSDGVASPSYTGFAKQALGLKMEVTLIRMRDEKGVYPKQKEKLHESNRLRAKLRADGFTEIETQDLDPRPGKGRHRHLFAIRGLGPVDKRDSQISVSMIQDCLSRGGRIGARRSEQCGMGDNFTFATA